MAQQNHNYSYVYSVAGNTIWERVRVTESFLTGRLQALDLARLHIAAAQEKEDLVQEEVEIREAMLLKAVEESNNDPDNLELKLEVSKQKNKLFKVKKKHQEAVIQSSDHHNLTQDCVDEVNFLTEYLDMLQKEANKTRIPGKSNREMYEINYPLEARLTLMDGIIDEFAINGKISMTTVAKLRQDPKALEMATELVVDMPQLDKDGNVVSVEKIPVISPQLYSVIKSSTLGEHHEALCNHAKLDDVVSLPNLKDESIMDRTRVIPFLPDSPHVETKRLLPNLDNQE